MFLLSIKTDGFWNKKEIYALYALANKKGTERGREIILGRKKGTGIR